MNNVPVKSLKHNDLTIEGYSRGAVQTYWRIPEMKIGFDLGAHPWDFTGTENWFISHTHLDHIAALPQYIARRRLMKMSPPTIYVPNYSKHLVQSLLQIVSRLDKGSLPCKIIGVHFGDEVELSKELVVTVHRTDHTIHSLGYVIWERRHKLRPEFSGLSGPEIKALRLGGRKITDERRIPKVAYLGDSTIKGLDDNPAMYEAEILIMEMTYVMGKKDRDGHIHVNDVAERQDKFKNQVVIASHFSAAYYERFIEGWIKQRLPGMLDGRFVAW